MTYQDSDGEVQVGRVFKTIEAFKRHMGSSVGNDSHFGDAGLLTGNSKTVTKSSHLIEVVTDGFNRPVGDEYGRAVMVQAVRMAVVGKTSDFEVGKFLHDERAKVEVLAKKWNQDPKDVINSIPLSLSTAVKRLGVDAEELNHLLKPLVDELKLFMNGVWFTSTCNYPEGQNIKAVVFPLIADLPALRKTAGFSGHSATKFCSFCEATKDSINEIDINRFEKRVHEAHLEKSLDVLNELEYWRPIDFCVIEVMHNLALGNLKDHCLSFLGLKNVAEQLEKHLSHNEAWKIYSNIKTPFEHYGVREGKGKKQSVLEMDADNVPTNNSGTKRNDKGKKQAKTPDLSNLNEAGPAALWLESDEHIFRSNLQNLHPSHAAAPAPTNSSQVDPQFLANQLAIQTNLKTLGQIKMQGERRISKIASGTGLPSHTGQDVLQELFQNIVTSNPRKSASDIEITFDWNIKSFSSSPWNNAQSIILVEHYIGWVQSQKEISEVEISFLPKLLERWVINKGKEIESSRGLSEEALIADKKIKLQKAHCKQIPAQIFTSKFPRFIILFGDSGTTSEVEDGDDINQFPRTLKPLWRSQDFTDCCYLLDCCTKQTAVSSKKVNSTFNLYNRSGSRDLESNGIQGVPVGLPSNVYAGEFVAGLSKIQNMELKKQPSCDLVRVKAKLQQKLGLGGSSPGGGGSNTPQSAHLSDNRLPSDQPITQQNQSSRMILDN
ncbi:hypothetical protein PPACK8108_LOCUS23192 [Phakopsora pachyrhizi]|uniref:Uncharacterized protein n=1 Tax=Phakopsora pachyrhizi TaxID=170000 RepID=A0AAV0BLX2_PHAPC|nr:hypothetical protein PPACK8108_LOCUS23192 [Phakopsora pachyrhizi]